jgi:hypothetical protein
VEGRKLQREIAEGVRSKVLGGTISEVRGKPEPAASPKPKAASE